MNGRQRPRAASAPLPLLMGFGLFVATLVYLVAVSLTRRDAPVYTPSSAARARPADWVRAGDTLTIDATDGDRWHFVSLTEGRLLTGSDTARWQLAARRYRARPVRACARARGSAIRVVPAGGDGQRSDGALVPL